MDKEVIDLLESIDRKLSFLCNDSSLQREMLTEWKQGQEQAEARVIKGRESRVQRSEMLRGGW